MKNKNEGISSQLSIVYNSSKSPGGEYYCKIGNDIEELNTLRNEDRSWLDLDSVLKHIDISNRNYKKIKYCDPNLIEILYNKFGVKGVNTYLEQLEKGKRANKRVLQFSMKYNLRSIWKNKGLPLKKKMAIIKIAKKNKYLADVKMDSKIGKRVASIFASIGLALTGAPKMLPLNAGNIENNKSMNNNAFVDCVDRVDTYNSEKSCQSEESKINKDGLSIFSQNLRNEINGIAQGIIDKYNNDNKQIQKDELHLGFVLKLPSGIQFMEGVSGGAVGRIGDSGSPADGIYVIDYIAETSDKGVINQYGLEGKFSNKMDDSKQFVHISLVHGARNLNEAKGIIMEQKKNAKEGVVDSNVIQPRGWMHIKDLQQVLEEQQENCKFVDDDGER